MSQPATARKISNAPEHSTAYYFVEGLNELGIEHLFCNFGTDHAPTIEAHLTDAAAAFYTGVREHLARFGVPFRENPRIVRGLDYYNRTVFEWVTDSLGSQGTVCAGGRYDPLIASFGGMFQSTRIGLLYALPGEPWKFMPPRSRSRIACR